MAKIANMLDRRILVAKKSLDVARAAKDELQVALIEDELNHLLDRKLLAINYKGNVDNVHHV